MFSLKLCNDFSSPCLRDYCSNGRTCFSNKIRYEKHLLSHVLIGLRWMLVKVGVKFFKAFNDVVDEIGIIF